MMNYLAKTRSFLSRPDLLEKAQILPIKLSKQQQQLFDRKKNFDLKEYEQIVVNHALEENKLVREAGAKFDIKLVNQAKSDINQEKLQQSMKFVFEG